MKELEQIKEIWRQAEESDQYWAQKAILNFTVELNQLMLQRNVTKKEYAEKLGNSQAYITKVFRGNANFTIETMVRLVRALKGKLQIHITPEEEQVTNWFRVIEKESPSQAKQVPGVVGMITDNISGEIELAESA